MVAVSPLRAKIRGLEITLALLLVASKLIKARKSPKPLKRPMVKPPVLMPKPPVARPGPKPMPDNVPPTVRAPEALSAHSTPNLVLSSRETSATVTSINAALAGLSSSCSRVSSWV